jgi:hypothetical protein
LREECRLRVFENRVLRRIFRCKRDEVTSKLRRIHNKGFHALQLTKYEFGNETKNNEMGGV